MRELEIYILLLLGPSFTAVQSQTDLVKPPKTKHEEELLVHENATLVCEGDKKFVWTFKYQDREVRFQEKINHGKVGDTHVSTLQLNNSNSQGHYYCHYENTDLSDPGASATTYVYLFSKDKDFAELHLSEEIGTIKGNKGDQVVLDCRPTHPNLTVVVEHGDKEIHRGPLEDPRVGFVLRNLTNEHRGDYLCKIHDVVKEFHVEVLGPPTPPWLNISKNTYPVVGYDMELYCRILDNKYEAEPTFTWIQPVKDNRTSQTTEHHRLHSHMFYTNYLRVRNVTLKDSGTYKCKVNIQGMLPTEMTSNLIIKETEDPFVYVKPVTQNLTCNKGENVTWELEVESFPPMPRFETNARFIHKRFKNGTNKLLIEKVAPSDFGEHTVTITTANNYSKGVKTARAQLYLTVLSQTELKIAGIRDTTEENSTITATCNATGYPMEKITWQYQSCPRGECPNHRSSGKTRG
ncbi:vascular endothelial growth factor receptor 1-like [Macrobrachium nipponense]|uniref:vascular endothelial growth factor receptor 1-like n=1 Tax=Macrobrachium nipponense TaxID=159736 RepID=UPI0030C80A11